VMPGQDKLSEQDLSSVLVPVCWVAIAVFHLSIKDFVVSVYTYAHVMLALSSYKLHC